jgi:hypothetical protein
MDSERAFCFSLSLVLFCLLVSWAILVSTIVMSNRNKMIFDITRPVDFSGIIDNKTERPFCDPSNIRCKSVLIVDSKVQRRSPGFAGVAVIV